MDPSETKKKLSLSKRNIHILLLENIHPKAGEVFFKAGYSAVVQQSGSLAGSELAEAIGTAHFIGIRSRTHLDAELLRGAKHLHAIGCFCIGTNQVALQAAAEVGIPVFNAPFSNTRSVAELVLAEMILLMRGVPARNAAAHRGEWRKSAEGSREIRGKTLGIIGYGHIGHQLGVLAEGMGMQVAFHDIEEKLPLGNSRATDNLEQLLAQSDLVSLHVPQTPETANMIGARELAWMKPGAFLINASRGNVVVIEALARALKSGHLSGAAIDVFPLEPKSNQERFQSPLCGMDNVILTPHVGGSTLEAQQNIAREVANKLIKYSDNGSTLSAVNFPQVSMPDLLGCHRLLHIHRNEPGVLQQINDIVARQAVNIAAQYLQTQGDIGYLVMDLEQCDAGPILAELRAIPSTIRTRVLY